MEDSKLIKQHETKSVMDLVHLYENGALELSPAFQRKSVWTEKDRRKLIDTLLNNYPVPAIFLYRYQQDGKLRYAVIDGKQRLETILGFLGRIPRMSFDFKAPVPGMDGLQVISAKTLKKNGQQREHILPNLMGYKVPVIEVEGELGHVMELFVRLNSTGKALSSQEKRHAKFSGSPLLRQAATLAEKLSNNWRKDKVMNAQKIARMKHVELAAELILSIHKDDVINKKAAIDKVMMAETIPPARLKQTSRLVVEAVNAVRKMFPDLHGTRFVQSVDYYSLVVLVAKLIARGAIVNDRKRNSLAQDMLKAFGVGVDSMREAQRKLTADASGPEDYRDYLRTVSEMTDNYSQRKRREQILEGVIGGLFENKDERRGFTQEQRRILWNTSADQNCTNCSKTLGWWNFTIDHVNPHSKGGRSNLDNAALMCRTCNSSKGNRRQTKRSSHQKTKSHSRSRRVQRSRSRRA